MLCALGCFALLPSPPLSELPVGYVVECNACGWVRWVRWVLCCNTAGVGFWALSRTAVLTQILFEGWSDNCSQFAVGGSTILALISTSICICYGRRWCLQRSVREGYGDINVN